MTNVLKKWPLHILIFVMYYVLFLYTRNSTFLPFSVVYKPLAYSVLFVSIEFLLSYIIFKDVLKAGLIVTAFNIPILSYGIVYDLFEKLYVKGFWPLGNIHRYLIIIVFVYFIVAIYWLLKSTNKHQLINYRLNVFFSILILINATGYLLNNESLNLKGKEFEASTPKKPQIKDLPDLYFILLDGYANEHILSKYYQYNNREFLNKLRQDGFYIADSSVANYYSTLLSLNATFNMSYNYDLANTQRNLDNNTVFNNLKLNGYKIYSLESGYSVTSTLNNVDSLIPISAPTEFERILLKYTILKLDDLLGLMHHHRINGQISKLDEISRIHNGPNFFFIHFVSPHPPYVFNEKGEHVYGLKNNSSSWEPKESYIQQLKYMNQVILNFIAKVSVNKNAAIILQSDHGPWIKSPNHQNVFEARSMVLNAVKFPKMRENLFYKKISLINTFRIFHNVYLNDSLNLLNDSLAGRAILERGILFNDLKQVETN